MLLKALVLSIALGFLQVKKQVVDLKEVLHKHEEMLLEHNKYLQALESALLTGEINL